MNDKLYKVLIFTLIIVAGAMALMLIPAFDVFGFEFRKADMLADIRVETDPTPALDMEDSPEEEADSEDVEAVIPAIEPDTCKEGIVCINDYSVQHNALSHFYEALAENNRPVRIAYFGDSFIEGDLLTCSLRDLFHEQYGGKGVGFVPIHTVTSGFRITVSSYAGGWSEHCITDSLFFRSKQGISGHYFIPHAGATATFACRSSDGRKADTCSVASFYFITDGNLKFTTTVNKKIREQYTIQGSPDIQQITVEGEIANIRITVDDPGTNTRFFGVSMDEKQSGVIVDNFSVRGTSGVALKSIPAKTICDFDSLLHYDLVILQYGLNVATTNGKKYDTYKKSMSEVLAYLRANFAKADFLLVGVGDRAMKSDGGMVTMPGVMNLSAVQQSVAAENEIAFWSLIDAMSLDGGIAGYVKSKPSKANLDYTHINVRGGETIAGHLFEAFEYGKEKYMERKNRHE
ncbi:MAG: hypothetical protein LBN71_00725 [Tannerella sp.]|jgi:hypothetical protein|nr:hypothetical protein [Tannerella sp.]